MKRLECGLAKKNAHAAWKSNMLVPVDIKAAWRILPWVRQEVQLVKSTEQLRPGECTSHGFPWYHAHTKQALEWLLCLN